MGEKIKGTILGIRTCPTETLGLFISGYEVIIKVSAIPRPLNLNCPCTIELNDDEGVL